MKNLKKLTTKDFNDLVAKNNKKRKAGKIDTIVYTNLDLSFVELHDVSFKNAEFDNVKFDYASFNNVDFSNTRFYNVTFEEAKFFNCIFTQSYSDINVSFRDAYFSNVVFTDANIESVSFYYTYLEKVNFTNANCCGTDFRNATIISCNFDNVRTNEITAGYNLVCPEKGAFTAFKRARLYNNSECIVELEVPADALRSSSTTRKCRVSKAKVVAITTIGGKPINRNAYSKYSKSFVYKIGKTVEVKRFDKNRWKECAPGIHCFITRDEAVQYCY